MQGWGGQGDEAPKRRAKVRTLPEQIADDLGAAIAKGELKGGERLREVEIAARYNVSRGPVREAIRALAQRGLAVFYPRRGAFVVELSLNTLIDLFNTRAVLLGLAARYFATVGSAEAKERLAHAIASLRRLGEAPDCDPIAFAIETGRVGAVIFRNCGSHSLSSLIEHQIDASVWGTLWRHEVLDFLTRERRLSAVGDYTVLREAIEQRDGDRADLVMRRIVTTARENAIAALSRIRAETYDERRLLRA